MDYVTGVIRLNACAAAAAKGPGVRSVTEPRLCRRYAAAFAAAQHPRARGKSSLTRALIHDRSHIRTRVPM